MKHRTDEELRWKTLSSEYLIKEPWMTVRRDRMQLPNGNINPAYWCLEYPDWINVIAITEDGHYIFERQYRHGLDIVEWEIPAGVVEKGEEPLHAAQRELIEETGFGGGEWELFMELCQNPSACNNISHTFIARGVKPVGAQHFDKTEDLDVYLLTEDEVRELLNQGDMKQALMVAPLWKYFYMKK